MRLSTFRAHTSTHPCVHVCKWVTEYGSHELRIWVTNYVSRGLWIWVTEYMYANESLTTNVSPKYWICVNIYMSHALWIWVTNYVYESRTMNMSQQLYESHTLFIRVTRMWVTNHVYKSKSRTKWGSFVLYYGGSFAMYRHGSWPIFIVRDPYS